tara:strand:+ start:231 stop:422 length:192 start_codon:yes stop_codon:yes gene_type:complete
VVVVGRKVEQEVLLVVLVLVVPLVVVPLVVLATLLQLLHLKVTMVALQVLLALWLAGAGVLER